MNFPIGAAVTLDQLADQPYAILAELRDREPVSWVPALDGWLITGRHAAIEAMRDDEGFTVDDPRFSTAAVLGASMLSLDGPEHQRHRTPFAPSFRAGNVRERFGRFLAERSSALIADLGPVAELRTELAGPLAVDTITEFLGLRHVTSADVLGWYRHISDAIEDVTRKRPISVEGNSAVRQINERVAATVAGPGASLLNQIERRGELGSDELAANAAVLMFGAIETAEAMTANAIRHLLCHPTAWAELGDDRSLIGNAIEESLRLEPAAAFVDRYATRDIIIGGVTIPERDPVSISLLAANRDPEQFSEPDTFDPHRANARHHLSFVQGPHACIGLHLTRMETEAAINALLDSHPGLSLNRADSPEPTGLIFRKPDRVTVTLDPVE